MKKILITGAAGFLGYNLCRDLGDNYSIYGAWHQAEPAAPFEGLVRMDLGGSLKPVAEYIARNGIQALVHCAALSRTGQCAADPVRARRLNIEGTRSLAVIAQAYRIPFIFISTDLVYNSGSGPHLEDDADPRMIYSETKFDAEVEAFVACPSTVVLRCALIFGPDDGVHGSFIRENHTDLCQGKALKLFTDQIRSPVWSRDIAEAIHRIFSQGMRSRIFNVGGSTCINRYELGMLAAQYFDWNRDKLIPVSMTGITADAPWLKDCSLNSARLQNETGWTATPLEKALKQIAAEWTADK
ncbi:sugar nucleotide-binding protein [bacterium]|nr:sugar nucleotide-binding protein [candidate division CSSED10-310 bacterium]